jgi:tetratricopeptide (TPR) repeat protein
MSQEIMHSLGMINHLYEAWAQHKYAMADPYPLGDTTWNQSFLALPEVTKNIKLSHYLMNLGAVKDARDVLISISLDSLTSSNQLLELVEAYTRSNQENFALDILREGISRFPLDFNIQKKLIYTLNLNQNYREADSLYQVWSISSAFVKQFRKDYDFQISRINTYLFLGDTSRAFRDALNLVNRKPNDPALHLLLAQLYILRSRKNYALKHIQRALSIDSTSLRTTYAVSMAYLQLGMYDLAQKWINVAASQDPTIVDRLHGLGLIE